MQVQQAAPQVSFVEQAQPTVELQNAEQPVVNLTGSESQANVQVEQTGEANVTYERAEPQVTINQAEGQPTITVEQMDADAADQSAAVAGEQPAAGLPGQMQRMVVADLEGMDVVTESGEQLGEVEGLVFSSLEDKQFVVIEHGGFLGLGEKRIALSREGLFVQEDRIVVRGLTDEDIEALPAFERTDQFVDVGDEEIVEFGTM